MSTFTYDLLVIGGGINGTGIARDAALRGLKVALIEASDLASGTSSNSSKLIHGGLRYLETYAFNLVRKSLQERTLLYKLAPHLVQPYRFHIDLSRSKRPKFLVRTGLFLYDLLAGFSSPFQRTTPIEDGYAYTDCWVDDARLVVLNALQAHEHGAHIRTYTPCSRIQEAPDHWQVFVEGQTEPYKARMLVNAAGPWVEVVQAFIPSPAAQAVRQIQGSHIIVPRLYQGTHCHTILADDGRVVFTLPYEENYTLIGTTDVPYTGDARNAKINDHEISYLCAVVNKHLQTNITQADIIYSYSGVRLLLDTGSKNASKLTRDYKLELYTHGQSIKALTVYGGKLTTFRILAAQALEKLTGKRNTLSQSTPLPGGDMPDGFDVFWQQTQQRYSFIPQSTLYRLCRAYGTRISTLLAHTTKADDLGHHFGHGLYEAEINYLSTYEFARTADDILWRRTKLGLHLTVDEQNAVRRFLYIAQVE